MPVQNVRRLILVDAKQIEFDSKNPKTIGQKITTWKYKFVDKDMKFHFGYDPKGILKDNVQTIVGWEDSKAKNYIFELSDFDGLTKEKLII